MKNAAKQIYAAYIWFHDLLLAPSIGILGFYLSWKYAFDLFSNDQSSLLLNVTTMFIAISSSFIIATITILISVKDTTYIKTISKHQSFWRLSKLVKSNIFSSVLFILVSVLVLIAKQVNLEATLLIRVIKSMHFGLFCYYSIVYLFLMNILATVSFSVLSSRPKTEV